MRPHIQTAILKTLNSINPGWVTEHRFHKVRKWRFDFSNPSLKVAIEVNGGVWQVGRHNRGKGYLGDLEKSNTAQLMGWTYLQYAPNQLTEMARDVEIAVYGNVPKPE